MDRGLIAFVVLNVLAVLFWGRGLCRGRRDDCVLGIVLLLLWPLLGLLFGLGCGAINSFGGASMAFGVLTLILRAVVPDRPLIRHRDLEAIAALMLIGGSLCTIILA
ncbi:MAG: hypothetical protein JXA69_08580 [Phycisphaerae bacterium]|nr:hypothetical protein [Phycisphaerae bacterium]